MCSQVESSTPGTRSNHVVNAPRACAPPLVIIVSDRFEPARQTVQKRNTCVACDASRSNRKAPKVSSSTKWAVWITAVLCAHCTNWIPLRCDSLSKVDGDRNSILVLATVVLSIAQHLREEQTVGWTRARWRNVGCSSLCASDRSLVLG